MKGAAFVGAVLCLTATANAAPLVDWLEKGQPILDVRTRYENVSDESKTFSASAPTLRLRVGYGTAPWHGLSLAAEFDAIAPISTDYNSTRNGKTSYATVADPGMMALNRLQLAYATNFDTTIVVGRQRLQLGDQRFIGNSGWRQHEQTFDAVSVANTSVPGLALTYAYVERVNRVFGPADPIPAAGPAGHFGSNSHLFNAVYTGVPGLNLEAYAYLLDLSQKGPASAMLATTKLSTATVGARAQFKATLTGGLVAQLTGAYAHQNDYADNPLTFGLDYWLAEGSLSAHGATLLAGYEAMGGNGTVGFSTPLASLHPFDGWADMFLTTPASGIDDAYFKAAYVIPDVLGTKALTAAVVHHDFRTDRGGTGIGSEWDASLEWTIDQHTSFMLALANYQGSGVGLGGFKDKSIGWLQAAYKL
jgi:hypothetical protein